MRAVVLDRFGGSEVLRIGKVQRPVPGPWDLLVEVKASGVNRADVIQRRGFYPPPPGESEVLGLEVAGVVASVGSAVVDWRVGDRVFGLVAGGGYAEFCLLDARLALAIPESWSYSFAAAIPETFMTAHESLFEKGHLSTGEVVLIHGGGSGVGSSAIQMARMKGAQVVATSSSGKRERCLELGAACAIDYQSRDFVEVVREFTRGLGADVILDVVGAAYLGRNIDVLAKGGRLVLIGLLGGRKAELDLGSVITKRIQIIGSVMRSLVIEEKAAIRQRFESHWLGPLLTGSIAPVIDSLFPFEAVAEAHRKMEASQHFGKIVLVLA